MEAKNKRDSRIKAVQLLYNIELLGISVEEALEDVDVMETDTKTLINSIINGMARIDSIISSSLTNYTIDRLGFVDRAIVRVCTYEMMSGLAPEIAINEALEITKMFSDNGDGKAKAFNNKLLDTISKNIGD